MGVCSSKDTGHDGLDDIMSGGSNGDDAPKTASIAHKQRRKLSVVGHHVGDITAGLAAMNVAMQQQVDEVSTDVAEMEKTARKNLKHASLSRKGLVPFSKKKYNQDRAVVKYALNGDAGVSMFGVMDGHGEFGHHVSTFVQDKLPACLEKHDIRADPTQAILDGTKMCVEQLAQTNIKLSFSGTTCVYGVLVDKKIYCANIGDSRGVVLREKEKGGVEAIPISFDQKPENPGEKERILAAGGRVEPLPGQPGEDCGPHRVWLAEVDVPGLAMSRSIGDEVSQTVGVISVPEITTHELSTEDRLAVWASDGVWEFITSEEAATIIWKHRNDLKKAALALVDESTRRWKAEEEVIDDITCVIVEFVK